MEEIPTSGSYRLAQVLELSDSKGLLPDAAAAQAEDDAGTPEAATQLATQPAKANPTLLRSRPASNTVHPPK